VLHNNNNKEKPKVAPFNPTETVLYRLVASDEAHSIRDLIHSKID